MKDVFLNSVLGLSLVVGTAIAANAGSGAIEHPEAQGPVLSAQQKLEIFPQLKPLQLQHLKSKQAILQKTDSCINSASNYDALKLCQHDGWLAGRQETKDHVTQIKQLYAKYGIQLSWPEHPHHRDGNTVNPQSL